MPALKSNQILIVVLSATAGFLITKLLFNDYQAICAGIIIAIFVYGLILTLAEKKPPNS